MEKNKYEHDDENKERERERELCCYLIVKYAFAFETTVSREKKYRENSKNYN